MLPLTEGSLRLRADDEDSLTSEDSFFSATEVIGMGNQVGLGQAFWASTRSWGSKVIFLGENQALLPRDSPVRVRRPEKPGVVDLQSEHGCPLLPGTPEHTQF